MSKTLATLVRLTKYKVEKAQEALAEAEARALELAQWLRSTEESRSEAFKRSVASDDVQIHLDAAHYDARLKLMVDKIKQDLLAAEDVVSQKRADLAKEYAEKERYALLLAREEEKVRKRRAAKQQDALDDIAGQAFTRRRDGF